MKPKPTDARRDAAGRAVFIAGIAPRGSELEFSFEGRTLSGHGGEAIASALLRHGESAFRRTASGDARGYYCGMGICWDCAVRVQDVGVVRSCAYAVSPGLVVWRADGPNS